ncbi:hypothetical protein Hanom_Chr14g01269941 [Helianthus anomalus]
MVSWFSRDSSLVQFIFSSIQVWVWLGLCSVFSQVSSFGSTQYNAAPVVVFLANPSESNRASIQDNPPRSILFPNTSRALFQGIFIRNHCEYTRSLFPLYALGCNMYDYRNSF